MQVEEKLNELKAIEADIKSKNKQIELLENKMEMASEKKTFLLKQIGLNTYEELTSELNNLQNELNKILALYEENKKAYDEIQ